MFFWVNYLFKGCMTHWGPQISHKTPLQVISVSPAAFPGHGLCACLFCMQSWLEKAFAGFSVCLGPRHTSLWHWHTFSTATARKWTELYRTAEKPTTGAAARCASLCFPFKIQVHINKKTTTRSLCITPAQLHEQRPSSNNSVVNWHVKWRLSTQWP